MIRTHSTGRDIAMLAGGIAAGVLGGRLLPPLIGAATGSGRVRAGADPFERLIDDHRQILSTLDKMANAPGDSRLNRMRLFISLKRKLAKHALAEEDVVYPLLHRDARQSDESKHLYDEHADMKIMLYSLEELAKSGEDWSEPVRSLRNLVQRHANEEEQTVFPQLREVLQRNRMPKLSGQIRREEAMIA